MQKNSAVIVAYIFRKGKSELCAALQPGNFSQADAKLAEKWNEQQKDGRTDWTDEDVYEWRHDPAHQCSWHERCDTKTMDLVPYDIHSYCKHLGGVSECKARDSVNDGGGFDE